VEVGVQLDHGSAPLALQEALDLGFTSIMIDGSDLSMAENIRRTRYWAKKAEIYGASVEAEVGVVGGEEGGEAREGRCAKAADAVLMAEESRCASLAVAIGNVHGRGQEPPSLNFSLLAEISALVHLPLVLHGGTGLAVEDFVRAASLGMVKINIATATFESVVSAIVHGIEKKFNYFSLSSSMVEGACENALSYLRLFPGPDREQ
jgi:fructose-bisphosphate aldolase class II